jgi:hypothetical protein
MDGLQRLRGDVVAGCPERVAAGLAFAVGNLAQLFLIQVYKAQILHDSLPLVVNGVEAGSSVSPSP